MGRYGFPELSRGAARATLWAVVTTDYASGVGPVWRQSARQRERPGGPILGYDPECGRVFFELAAGSPLHLWGASL